MIIIIEYIVFTGSIFSFVSWGTSCFKNVINLRYLKGKKEEKETFFISRCFYSPEIILLSVSMNFISMVTLVLITTPHSWRQISAQNCVQKQQQQQDRFSLSLLATWSQPQRNYSSFHYVCKWRQAHLERLWDQKSSGLINLTNAICKM